MAKLTHSTSATPQAGYTLPVFACAGAIAALRYLLQPAPIEEVSLDLLNPPQTATIPIEQIAPLPDGSVLAVTRSDPGDNLDLTRSTPIWAMATWGDPAQHPSIAIEAGEGIGRQAQADNRAAIYRYATRLLEHNLRQWLPSDRTLRITLIMPEGRALAARTSNAAFGIVEGLSLLGTSGISQPLSAPGQLEEFRKLLQAKATQHSTLVFCIGENGLDLALKLGIPADCRIKTANWLGPMLVEAGFQGIRQILLLGYHGKLVKLAGGIFHTHHHVADGRQEILAAHCAVQGLPQSVVTAVLQSPTVEAGLGIVREFDPAWVRPIYAAISDQIDQRSVRYIHTHSGQQVTVGSLLFDRHRNIIVTSSFGNTLLEQLLVDL
jgi:cobalt-precorrin-5B (C1)-methyltransferase